MGLDMYLEAKKYISGWDHNKEGKEKNKRIRKMFPELNITGETWGDNDNLGYIIISFEVGYWRKANAIHRWFVENVQDGRDDCKPYFVSREQLTELKKICKEVLENKNKAPELLPTQDGFFFGSVEYDEWYYKDIENTIRIIDKCLALPDDYYFEYLSSW